MATCGKLCHFPHPAGADWREGFIFIILALATAASMFVFFRFGLISFIMSQLIFSLLTAFPITTDLSAWYFGIGSAIGKMLPRCYPEGFWWYLFTLIPPHFYPLQAAR
jgi:hypothetical protein